MKTAKRLLTSFTPEHYDLSLHIDKDKLSFRGEATIQGRVLRPAQRLTLHQRDLTITSATITRHDKKREHTLEITRIMHHKGLDEVRLHTDEKIYPGPVTVTVMFAGKITPKMLGIYPSYLTTEDGQKSTIIASQFESHYAREAFPCIDEPSAKATFSLTISLPAKSKDVVLSNTPLAKEETKDSQRLLTFETTPKMSTYLLAFVLGDLHCVESKTKDGVVVRSWGHIARPKSMLQYSVDEAVTFLNFFSDYFGIPYPLAKCDQVALPDFDVGAMENWGLITYRETALLSDSSNPSISGQQYISLVIAHELSHQWFGNLVTMKWWDDLWLNESFASLMEFIALTSAHPDWQSWEQYAASDVLAASNRDIYKDIQPVGVKVTDPDLIDTLFDPGIVYAKGGRLLKMLREYIGDEAFRAGLQIYFQRHQYANTSREDLWTALGEASGKDVASLMTPWLTQPGMPMVTVNETEQAINLNQQRFLLDANDDSTVWPIPLLSKPILKTTLLTDTSTVDHTKTDNYVLLNQFGSGHFITYYQQADHRADIAKRLQGQKVPTEARINILNDMQLLARRGVAGLVDALEVVHGMASEPRDNVWGLIARAIGSAAQLTEGNETAEEQLRQIRRELAGDWFAKLGWDDEPLDDPNTKQLRHTALAMMIGGEAESALTEAKKRFTAAEDLEKLPAEIRSTILSVAIRHGDKANVDRLLQLYPAATPDMQADITAALSSTKKADVASHILTAALGPKGFVRNQDIMRWLASFMRNRHTRPVMWQWIIDNWSWLESTVGQSKTFDFLPIYCAGVMNTPEWEKKFHDVFEPHVTNKTLERNIRIGFADIAARVAWRQRDEAKITKWLGSVTHS